MQKHYSHSHTPGILVCLEFLSEKGKAFDNVDESHSRGLQTARVATSLLDELDMVKKGTLSFPGEEFPKRKCLLIC